MNFNYHIYKPYVKCPYCNEIYEDYYDIAGNLEERIEAECESCGKKFYAESCIVFNTYSDCELNDERHDFKPTESHPTVFNCENCSCTEVRSR